MVVNDVWTELIGLSKEKLNAMTIVAYSGAEISALSSTAVDGQVVYCHTTGSGYERGHWYGWDDSLGGGTWVDLVALPDAYTHFSDDMFAFEGCVIDRRSTVHQDWNYDFVGSGTDITDFLGDNNTQHIILETGTTTTGYAALYANGPKLDWGKPAMFACKFQTSTGAVTGQINKLGVNIDRAGLGPSTRRNFGVEWCDGDSSFQIHSGNGTSQSNFDTQITVTTDAIWSIKCYFDPGNEIRVLFDDGSTVTEKIKTTFVPSSGASTTDGIMKLSICNNNSNTTERYLKIFGAYIVYNTNDAHWT